METASDFRGPLTTRDYHSLLFNCFQNVEELVNENSLLKKQMEVMVEPEVCDSFTRLNSRIDLLFLGRLIDQGKKSTNFFILKRFKFLVFDGTNLFKLLSTEV